MKTFIICITSIFIVAIIVGGIRGNDMETVFNLLASFIDSMDALIGALIGGGAVYYAGIQRNKQKN